MKDIRRRSHNLKSNQAEERILNHRKNKEEERANLTDKVEHFENRDYNDIEYTNSGKPLMKASSHFDLVNGIEKSGKRRRDSFDVLKRSEFFNKNRKTFDKEDLKTYRHAKRRKNKLGKRILFSLILIGLLTLVFLTFVFNRGVLTVNPKYKDVDVNTTLLIFKDDFITDVASSSLTKNILKSEPREINQRAHGELTIYNNYSDKPQILIKNTRFQSADGKIFKIGDSITVPGKVGNTPGSIKVNVTADSYGADYNIPAGKFTIPGLKNNPRYNFFYAVSDKSMSGGISGVVQAVAQSDIDQAVSDLTPQIESDLKSDSQKISHDGYYTLTDSTLTSISNNSEDLVTSQGNTFSINGLASIFSIKESVLASLIAGQTLGDIYNTNQEVRLDNISNLQIKIATSTEINPTILKIQVVGKARIIWAYDALQLKKSLSGQKLSALSNIIDKYNSSILNARAKIKPLWRNYFPKDINKISIVEEIR